jgi:hypothetical protein
VWRDLQVIGEKLGYLLGRAAIPRFDFAQAGKRAAHFGGKLFLRQIERLPPRLEPTAKCVPVIHQ